VNLCEASTEKISALEGGADIVLDLRGLLVDPVGSQRHTFKSKPCETSCVSSNV
jgi:hypothetical protein